MAKYTLTLVEVTGIQEYIFGSNRLSINIGASALVESVTSEWLIFALPAPHNLSEQATEIKINDENIESHGLRSEVVYRGGGNALILFATRDLAVEFTKKLSRKILIEAPGLQVIFTHQDIDWQKDSLYANFENHPMSGVRKGLLFNKVFRIFLSE
jgi:hypothetical protein